MRCQTDKIGGRGFQGGRAIIARYRALAKRGAAIAIGAGAGAMVDFDNFIPYSAVDAPQQGIEFIAEGLQNALCFLQERIPYAHTPPNNQPGGSTVSDFWNQRCGRSQTPTGQDPAIARGCNGTQYQVTANYTFFGQPEFAVEVYNAPVVNAYWRPIPSGQVAGINVVDVVFCDGTSTFFGTPNSTAPPNYVRNNIEIAPLGAEGSVCCDDIPIPPIFNDIPPEVTINLPDGPIQLPITLPELTLDTGGNIIGFAPVFVTPIGRFSFDLGGVTFSPQFALNPNIRIPIGGGGSSQGGATPSEVSTIVDNSATNTVNQLTQVIQQSECDLTPVLQAIDSLDFQLDFAEALELIRCYIVGGGGTIQPQSLVSSSAGGTWTLPDTTFAVVFGLQTPPTQATPIQKGAGDAPDVFFWGSYSVNQTMDGQGDRLPLHFASQVVPVPPGSNSVTMLPVYQNTGSVIALQRLPACAQPEEFIIPIDQPNPITTQTSGNGDTPNGIPD